MAMAHAGFVFLSMPKAGSTVLQKHFAGTRRSCSASRRG